MVDTELLRSRVDRPVIDALDAWAADQAIPEPRRPEAIRRALTEHLRAKGYLSDDGTTLTPDSAAADKYADAEPNEAVMVTGVGPMILSRAVRKRDDWREHHGLEIVSVFRGAGKEPNEYDMSDLERLAEKGRFK